MKTKCIERIEEKLAKLKADIAGIGPLMPGSVVMDYSKHLRHGTVTPYGPYARLVYEHHNQKFTRYVSAIEKAELERRMANLTKLRQKIDEWITLSIELANLEEMEKEKAKPTMERIKRTVARYYGVSVADLEGPRSTVRLVTPRRVAMFMMKEYGWIGKDIGAAFNGRKMFIAHSGCLAIQRQLRKDANLRELCSAIKADLESATSSEY